MELPQAIQETFKQLKMQYNFYITLKQIKNRYYVYRQSSHYSTLRKKSLPVMEYLGRIIDTGEFVAKSRLKKEKQHIQEERASFGILESQIDKVEEILLRTLSMNARYNLANLRKEVHLTPGKIYNKVRTLEQRYGIRYIPEIDIEKLGYSKYILLVKFEEQAPPSSLIKQLVSRDSRTQMALQTNGDYDLLIYFLAKNTDDASDFVWSLQKDELFKGYVSRWYYMPFDETYGFIPIREEFFNLLKERVWVRSKVAPRPERNQLLYREYILLRELNKDASKKFSEIDTKYKFGSGTSQYYYRKLKSRGVLRRLTLTMEKLPIKYNAIFLISVLEGQKYYESRKNFFFDVLKEQLITNRYALVGDMALPFGILTIAPVYQDSSANSIKEGLSSKIKGVGISVLTSDVNILGNLCYRRFDNIYAPQAEKLETLYGIPRKRSKVNYQE